MKPEATKRLGMTEIRLFLLIFIVVGGVRGMAAELPEYTFRPASEAPSADYGSIDRFSVSSRSLDASITVDVWVPQSYNASSGVKYPVLYVFDGQNLFDPKQSFADVAWELDQKSWTLSRDGKIDLPIIVGIHNRGSINRRTNDYFPEKALGYLSKEDRAKSNIDRTCPTGFSGDEHASFVATELKPLIDNLYNTDPNPSHTIAMGSSMGALAAIYMMCEYPDIFSAAGCLSTHWIGSLILNPDYSMTDDPICADAILQYLTDNLPSPLSHRLYLDQGTTGWDAMYIGYDARARQIASDKGYSESGGTLMTYDAQEAGHNEWYWQQRVATPLSFLLSSSALASLPSIELIHTGPEEIICDINGRPVNPRLSLPASHTTLAPGLYITTRRRIILLN